MQKELFCVVDRNNGMTFAYLLNVVRIVLCFLEVYMKVFDLISMNSEQADIIGLARQICEKELLPHVAELDREGRYPVEDIGVQTPLKYHLTGKYPLETEKPDNSQG